MSETGDGWARRAVEAATTRAAAHAKEATERGERIAAEEAQQLPRAEQEVVDRKAREAKAREQYEAIAASVQRSAAARAKARRPMSEYDRKIVGQALGEGWDTWEGPQPAA